jgi:diguanylate cyclase (GGDEF)-like protein/PAS domain S-box-containing protein
VKNSPSNDVFAPLSWFAALGFTDPKVASWGEVRAAQKSAFHNYELGRLALVTVAVWTVFVIFRSSAPAFYTYGWLGLILVLSIFREAYAQQRQKLELLSISRSELHNETRMGFVMGILWGMLPFLFAPYGTSEQLFPLWLICAGMMTGAAVTQSAIPLATAIVILLAGSGLCVAMWQAHQIFAAILSSLFGFGLIIITFINGRDFINHKYASLALVEKSEVVSMLLREYEDEGGDWMWQTDASRCLTHVSPRFAQLLGVQPDALESKPLLQILAGELWETGNFSAGLRDLADKLKNRESFSDLIIPVTVNGDVFWWELSASPRFDERGVFLGFRGVGSDVSDAHRSADKINRMARFDTLTGLPNRLQINETVAHVMNETKRWNGRCGFMMIDLDRFKAVNDTLGHPVGDRLLTMVAERLNTIMTPNELCGRLGGDEFAVVVKDLRDPNYLNQLGRKIIESLSRPYDIDQNTLFIGASVGTAAGPRDGRTVEMLVRSADLALYRSKDAGGNAVFAFEPQLHAEAEERRVLELALRKALERNEFQLHYQPVVNAKTGVVESFEALLRWTNPELGNVSPAKFIPIAEDARLIAAIGEWALRTACNEASAWPSNVRIAVNVSAEQLTNVNFVSSVVSALSQSGLKPERLELEVTESIFMKEGTTAIKVLDRILSLGVRLALDDFGTGYSSLGYLSKTKFSTIKVDRSFVQGASRNLPECIAIIRAVVALAESLGMSTTAEGVETDEESQMINALGCRKIQGYLYGRPMPSADARKLLHMDAMKRVA